MGIPVLTGLTAGLRIPVPAALTAGLEAALLPAGSAAGMGVPVPTGLTAGLRFSGPAGLVAGLWAAGRLASTGIEAKASCLCPKCRNVPLGDNAATRGALLTSTLASPLLPPCPRPSSFPLLSPSPPCGERRNGESCPLEALGVLSTMLRMTEKGWDTCGTPPGDAWPASPCSCALTPVTSNLVPRLRSAGLPFTVLTPRGLRKGLARGLARGLWTGMAREERGRPWLLPPAAESLLAPLSASEEQLRVCQRGPPRRIVPGCARPFLASAPPSDEDNLRASTSLASTSSCEVPTSASQSAAPAASRRPVDQGGKVPVVLPEASSPPMGRAPGLSISGMVSGTPWTNPTRGGDAATWRAGEAPPLWAYPRPSVRCVPLLSSAI